MRRLLEFDQPHALLLFLDLLWLRGLRRETYVEAADFRRTKAITKFLAFETLEEFRIVDPEVETVARAAILGDSVVSDEELEAECLLQREGTLQIDQVGAIVALFLAFGVAEPDGLFQFELHNFIGSELCEGLRRAAVLRLGQHGVEHHRA